MVAPANRPLRADAVRNAERILRAARDVYAEAGPDPSIEAIADRAGVGERTLYRRFPTKGELIRAALDLSIAESLAPVIERARSHPDPLEGLEQLIEAATALGAREHHLLSAARKAGALGDISGPLDAVLVELARRAQAEGLVRDDLTDEDLPRLVMMLNSVLWTMDPDSEGWRRYAALMFDAISTAGHRPLPPAVPIRTTADLESWPL